MFIKIKIYNYISLYLCINYFRLQLRFIIIITVTLDLNNIKTQEMSTVNNNDLNNQNDDSNEPNNSVRITRSAHHYIIFQVNFRITK